MSTATSPAPTKKAPRRRASSTAAPGRTSRRRTAEPLPAWADLPASTGPSLADRATRARAGARKASQKAAAKVRQRGRALDAVPSLRFGLMTLAACVVLVLFVGHAYATRATLDALQDARRENERLRLTHQRLQGDVDRMTGPSAVMQRAGSLGLEEGVAYGPTVRLGADDAR